MINSADPTLSSLLRPLHQLLKDLDGDIARVYADRGVDTVRPRFSMALIRLRRLGPMTIHDLAREVRVSHSAMSQTVTAMKREGLVAAASGNDARTMLVSLTEAGARLVPFLETEWRATEAALADLDAELPYPITQVVRDMEAALARTPFKDRILHHLAALETKP